MVLLTRTAAKCAAKSTTNKIVNLERSTSTLFANDLDGVDDGMTEAYCLSRNVLNCVIKP